MPCVDDIAKVLTVRGLALLDAQIAEWERLLKESQEQTRDRNARGCGSSVSGAIIPDDATRQHELYRARIDRLKHIRRTAKKVPAPTDRKVLRIDTVGTFMYWTLGEGRRGIEHRLQRHIVGWGEHDCHAVPQQLSYADELAREFLGQTVGYSSEVFFEGKVRTVRLTAIRLISDKGVIRPPSDQSELRTAV